jgi:phosphoenolpyruvate-protein phosphotransferase
MVQLQGKGVSKGIAIGRLVIVARSKEDIVPLPIQDAKVEIARFENARSQATTQLGELATTLAKKIGAENSLLFEIHQMMLDDLDYRETVEYIIAKDKVCAEYAVSVTAKQFSEKFSSMDDEYMKARAADVVDISRRVINLLTGQQQDVLTTEEPAILFSDDFTPSETAQLDRNKVLALVTAAGSSNSHTAIFARTMGIPAIIGLGDLDTALHGEQVVLDGETGVIFIRPDMNTVEKLHRKERLLESETTEQRKYIGKPTISRGGQRIKLFANIGSVNDVYAALEHDAEGIGLFRSEFLYLESDDYPTEEVQFEAYRTVAEKMNGKEVIIRTLDIGADKQAGYFNLSHEENPAMGLRAIRICLSRTDVFITQLRAILRASAFGDISILLPMIASVWEVQEAKRCVQEVQKALMQDGIAYNQKIKIGAMIETPAAAIISDDLAKEVDFFSIGTNDLTQYTLAADRQNDAISKFCNPHHPAVLRLIEMVVRNAHINGVSVGICGELAADMELTKMFLDIGIDELSVAPPSVLALRQHIHNL